MFRILHPLRKRSRHTFRASSPSVLVSPLLTFLNDDRVLVLMKPPENESQQIVTDTNDLNLGITLITMASS